MAQTILSEISSFVLPSHRGLQPLEIVQDCLEKAQLLAAMGISSTDNIEQMQCPQFLSMLDDWIALAQHQLVTALNARTQEQSL